MNEYSYSERHMGTEVNLSLVCPHKDMADPIAKKIFATIHEYEQRFSRFLPSSELSRLNRHKSSVMSSTFITVLKQSLDLARLTKNTFNPLVQVSALGYNASYAALGANSTTASDLPYSTDTDVITINTKNNSVALGPQQQLDFGGILKGYLAALIADEVMEQHPVCTGCIINIGGDIATRGYDEFHEPFIFLLYNPLTGTELPVRITDMSLATSGTYVRTWSTNGRIYNHIVDGQSQQNPTQNIVAASIIARDGALTEALTKLYLMSSVTDAVLTVPPHMYDYRYFIVSNTGDSTTTII